MYVFFFYKWSRHIQLGVLDPIQWDKHFYIFYYIYQTLVFPRSSIFKKMIGDKEGKRNLRTSEGPDAMVSLDIATRT